MLLTESSMDDNEGSRGRGSRRGRRGWGCGGFLFVLIVGLALSIFNTDIGVGLSVRVPFTHSNLTLAASIGAKQKTGNALPDYTRGRLGGNQDFINHSQTLTIGPAEGATLLVLGKQDGAPVIDLHLVAR
jgi:hypothetical protein